MPDPARKRHSFGQKSRKARLLTSPFPCPVLCLPGGRHRVDRDFSRNFSAMPQVNLRSDFGSTLELHTSSLHCKHKSLLRSSHHFRVCLTRGGQGHQLPRGNRQRSRSWLLYKQTQVCREANGRGSKPKEHLSESRRARFVSDGPEALHGVKDGLRQFLIVSVKHLHTSVYIVEDDMHRASGERLRF